MKNVLMVMVAVMVLVAFGGAADTPWQYDRATVKAMSIPELEAKADSLRAEKDYQTSSLLFQEALRRQPKNAILLNKLGLVQLQLKETTDALSSFNKAIKLNSKFPEALNNLGTAYFLLGRTEAAAKYYRKALALNETRAVFHANLAAAWISQNKFNLALKEYARALELDPEILTRTSAAGVAAQVSTPEQRASRFFLMARVFAIRGDFDSAIEYLKKAKEEGYRGMDEVYKQQEFQKLWSDARLAQIVPSAHGK